MPAASEKVLNKPRELSCAIPFFVSGGGGAKHPILRHTWMHQKSFYHFGGKIHLFIGIDKNVQKPPRTHRIHGRYIYLHLVDVPPPAKQAT